jgi:acyl carrier protein
MVETIQDRVFRVISTARCIPLASVQPDCTFEELGIDSLDRLDILFALETELDVEIDDAQALKATRIGEIVAAIAQVVEAS